MTEKMSSPRQLTANEEMELNDWLAMKHIGLNHRTRRDLSDVVNMAVLFKNVDQKLVDMKNYTSHGKLALKLLNWETFNLKVLRKTGLILMRPALEQLALGDLNAIRSLLFHLMRIERDGIQLSSRRASPTKSQKRQAINTPSEIQGYTDQYSIDTLTLTESQSQILIHTVSQGDTQAKKVAQAKMSHDLRITNANYEELKRINDKKEKYICSLSHKVLYLEKVIQDKEQRINQLLEHLSTLSLRILSMQTSHTDEELLPNAPSSTLAAI